jgi:flagellar motor component MotA
LSELPEWLAGLAGLRTIDIHGTAIKNIPAVFSQKNIAILREYEFMPEHELNYDDFIHCYYHIVRKTYEFSEKCRAEGLLALEDWLEDMGNNDLFKYGLRLVVDGNDAEVLRDLLLNVLEREHDPYKRILKEIQIEAILSIQAGDNPYIMLLKLDTMVDIPDNKISAVCDGHYSSDSFDVSEALTKISHEIPSEREEIRFMRRALAMSAKSRREGLLVLEEELDPALLAARDVFEYGIAFAIDGTDRELIKSILDILITHEHDPWKRKLMSAKRDAALSIQAGDHPHMLALIMLSHFDKSIEDMVKEEFLAEW